jgi:hypothetical protein
VINEFYFGERGQGQSWSSLLNVNKLDGKVIDILSFHNNLQRKKEAIQNYIYIFDI